MRCFFLMCCAAAAFGQGTEPKAKPEDYDAHAQARIATIGAEFTVHSFSRGEAAFIAKDYLVVEVAVFPPKGETLAVQIADFSLRLNSKKEVLQPQPPSMVAASLKHPEWEQPSGPTVTVGGAAGNTGVVVGGPPRNPTPFPGSNPPGHQPTSPAPVPNDTRAGIEKEPVNAGVVLAETVFPEGSHHAPVSGFLFFPYKGKISSIKSLELLYEDAVLKLR